MKKKLLLSAAVIISFVAYSIHTRQEAANTVVGISTSRSSTSPSTVPTAPSSGQAAASYKDGSYTGSVADAFYGNIQVKAVIQGGKITDVQFLQHPNDQPNSIAINNQAMPLLKQEALAAQNSQVDTVTGATDTSQAFVQSLGAALASAKS